MKYLLFLLSLSFLIPTTANGQSTQKLATMEAGIDSIVVEGLNAKAYPGAQVLVAYQGKTIFSKSYGFHTYDSLRSVDNAHLYDLASITKVSTGLPLLMQELGRGNLDIEAPLENYFPKFKNSAIGAQRIKNILSHQAGLKPYIVYYQKERKKNGEYKKRFFRDAYSNKYSIRITDALFLNKKYKNRIHKYIRKAPVVNNPSYKYSGLFFLLLPDIIERITRESYPIVLYKSIYEKIGADRLCYNPTERFLLEQIVPTEFDSTFRNQLVHGTVHDEAAAMLSGVSCNAGLFGNAESLAKLFQLYLDNGQYNGEMIIDSAAVSTFTSRHFEEDENRRGLGFDKPLLKYKAGASHVAEKVSPESFGHGGFTGTFVWADPTNDILMVFLSNRVYPSRENRKVYQMDIRPRIQGVIYNHLLEK